MRFLLTLICVLEAVAIGRSHKVYDVRDYGATGDGIHDDTPAITRALDLCQQNGGGTVLLTTKSASANIFLSKPIWIYSNTIFKVNTGATFLANPDFVNYPVVQRPQNTGTVGVINVGKCITPSNDTSSSDCKVFQGATNVTLTGGGTIDGNGQNWWYARTWWADNRLPMLLHMNNANFVHIYDITITRPPSHHTYFFNCTNLLYERGVITAGVLWTARPFSGQNNGFNTDGVDTFSCTNVTVRHMNIHAGDDCIAIFAPLSGIAAHNHTYYNISCQSPVSICAHNSQAPIQDITFKKIRVNTAWAEHDNNYDGLQWKPRWWRTALRLKSNFGQPGHVENIHYTDIQVSDVDLVFEFQMWSFCQNSSGMANWDYCKLHGSAGGHQPPSNPAQFATYKNIQFENIVASNVWRVGWLPCPKESPCTNIQFENVTVKSEVGWECSHVHGYSKNTSPDPAKGCFTSLV